MSGGQGRGSGRGSGSSSGNADRKRDMMGTIQPDLFTRPTGAPKTGTSGTPVDTLVNFIPIDVTENDYYIYQYHVEFEPPVDSKTMRSKILRDDKILNEIGEFNVFDGMIMYIKDEWKTAQTIEVEHPNTGEPIVVKFKLSLRYSLNEAQTINVFNTIFRRCFDTLELLQLGRNYFDQSEQKSVRSHNMKVLPGYETAIRRYENQLMLCIENRFKMMRSDNMYQLIIREYQNSGNNIERTQEKINELYGGTTITSTYNNKLHRFTRLSFDLSPLTPFNHNGREITLKEYFFQQYKKEIKFDDQPIIISEGKPKQPGEPPQVNYLIPELCNPTGLTDEMRKDTRLMKEIAQHTRLSPEQRVAQTRHLIERLLKNPHVRQCLEYWGITVGSDLANVVARQLPQEKIIANGDYTGRNAEWAQGVKRNGIYRGTDMTNWIVIAPLAAGEIINKFTQEVRRLGSTVNTPFGQPLEVPLNAYSPTDYINALKESLEKVKGYDVHMIAVILPDDNKTRYDVVKKFLCVECPIPSQCINLRTLQGKSTDGSDNKNFGSIVLKIVLQMICKGGGALWKIDIPLKDTMIVGYDLYHDSTLRGKTIGACVSTTSPDFTEFYSQTRPHDNPTQLGTNLTHFVRKALNKYYVANNKTLPKRLILYRDGAGDGQIPYIKETEVKLVRDACDEIQRKAYGANAAAISPIQVAFIIVTKRVNMRIMKKAGARACNPDPGTLVDSVVTRPERMDFYMVPQFVNQGTVTPVSYNIIYDDTGLTPDKHHRMAFKLCHLYYNWQGTVRVPAPCQYAHKLAFLTAQSLHEDSNEVLRNKLYFL
ncbi:unnamed protein product [Caenorhabditis angaria]|uniref:Piwi domain-containing protein n=1 Tax=Caenorhabditis angaria TaxID=860376 RepID=A0A9P1MV90_9PELO|nr:unnamed protein product [Caenorhabditis angaria]